MAPSFIPLTDHRSRRARALICCPKKTGIKCFQCTARNRCVSALPLGVPRRPPGPDRRRNGADLAPSTLSDFAYTYSTSVLCPLHSRHLDGRSAVPTGPYPKARVRRFDSQIAGLPSLSKYLLLHTDLFDASSKDRAATWSAM